jgi:hypothetical protein
MTRYAVDRARSNLGETFQRRSSSRCPLAKLTVGTLEMTLSRRILYVLARLLYTGLAVVIIVSLAKWVAPRVAPGQEDVATVVAGLVGVAAAVILWFVLEDAARRSGVLRGK